MGYYTQYSLSMIEGSDTLIELIREECESAEYAIDEYGDCNESCKWYDAQNDIRLFSMKHIDAIFCLSGIGEDGESWKLYVQNGHTQMCKAKLVYPEFDKAKLQSDIRESKINKVIE